MTKRCIVFCALLLVCCVSVQAETKSPLNVYVSGGVFFPLENTGHSKGSCFDFGLGVLLPDPVSLVPSFGFFQSSMLTVIEPGVDLRVPLLGKQASVAPYLISGLGLAITSIEGSYFASGRDGTYLAYDFGVGLECALSKQNNLRLFLQVRYIAITGDERMLSLVPVEVGIKL